MARANYPAFPDLKNMNPDDADALRQWWSNTINELDKAYAGAIIGAANGKPFYIVTGVSVNRTLDVATVSTTADLANFVGTLATDLQRKGILA